MAYNTKVNGRPIDSGYGSVRGEKIYRQKEEHKRDRRFKRIEEELKTQKTQEKPEKTLDQTLAKMYPEDLLDIF